MKAVRVNQAGSSTELSVQDVPKPSIGPGELLVKIRASFVQPADILNSKGGFAMTTFPRTIGKDFAGTVVDGSDEWKGKDVYGTSGGSFSFTEDGAQAEYAVLKANGVAAKPKNISFAQAASVGTPFTTAFTALLRARTTPTDVVMVLGATGNVGSSVIQVAQNMGCKTISVGRHGTDVNSVEDPELKKAKDLTGGNGPDVVVDTVGDFVLTKAAFNVLANRGRLSTITAPRQGSTELAIDILSLYRRQVELIGCNTTAIPQEELAKLMAELTTGFENGKLTAPDESTMTRLGIDQAPDAYSGKAKRAVIVFDE
jgi:NADPH:quinone reductase-like Zn-dependent oxidoreductase